jgi:hypothetical protein
VRLGLGEVLPPGPFNELLLRKGFVDMRSQEPCNPHERSLMSDFRTRVWDHKVL